MSKIVILYPEQIFTSPLLDYLEPAEKSDIAARMVSELSLAVGILDDNSQIQMITVFDVCDKNSIHVREVAGKNIARNIGTVEIFAFALAKKYARKMVTFCTSKDGIEWIGSKMGYKKDENENIFYKVVA